jgi:hypothetical protein
VTIAAPSSKGANRLTTIHSFLNMATRRPPVRYP